MALSIIILGSVRRTEAITLKIARLSSMLLLVLVTLISSGQFVVDLLRLSIVSLQCVIVSSVFCCELTIIYIGLSMRNTRLRVHSADRPMIFMGL